MEGEADDNRALIFVFIPYFSTRDLWIDSCKIIVLPYRVQSKKKSALELGYYSRTDSTPPSLL